MSKKQEIQERCIRVADYIIEHKSTVRQAASYIGVSKSTIHKDISIRLASIDLTRYDNAKAVLDYNKSVKHLRGGNATAKKYGKPGRQIESEKSSENVESKLQTSTPQQEVTNEITQGEENSQKKKKPNKFRKCYMRMKSIFGKTSK